jgi:hypothetical protein
MKSFKEYTESINKLGTLTIFDIDDTLFHTTAMIMVVKDGKIVKRLSNNEFNTYKLGVGETFDFSEFRDAKKFYDESKPISRMLDKAKILLDRSKANPNSKVVIVTARDDFNDKDVFLSTFRKHGFDIDDVRVERAGKIKGEMIPAFKKAIIIRNYLKTRAYSKVRLYDDAMSNLKEFLKLKKEFPEVTFEAYFAKPDGSITTIR